MIAVIFDAGIIIGLYFAEKIERKKRMAWHEKIV